MAVPLIPQFLAHRPTHNGLVVPYISLESGGRAYLGRTRSRRIAECLLNGLCQVCGRHLEQRPYLFLMIQKQIDEGFSSEPPLHPVCAKYSIQACPMVSGRMPTYAKHAPNLDGMPCDDPGCNCPGLIMGPNRAGDPSEPWFMAWYSRYDIGVRSKNAPPTSANITGAVLSTAPIKIRPIASIAKKEPWPTSPNA
jgi:hypothetical protein